MADGFHGETKSGGQVIYGGMENDEHRIRFDSGWHGGGVLESLRGRRIDRGGYPHRCGDMGIQKVEKMTLILKKKWISIGGRIHVLRVRHISSHWRV